MMDGCYQKKSSIVKQHRTQDTLGAPSIFSGFTQTNSLGFTNWRPIWRFSTFYINSKGCCLHSNITAFLWCILPPVKHWIDWTVINALRLHVVCRITPSLMPFLIFQITLAYLSQQIFYCKTQPSAAHHVVLPACNYNRSYSYYV